EFKGTLTDGSLKRNEKIEKDLQYFSELIGKIYEKCIGKAKGLSALLMLERIESAIESLYDRLAKVKPEFIEIKQKKRDEERSEQHRLAMAEKKEAEQRLKYEQAVERAQMPIKRRTGRPKVRRMLPIAIHQFDPEKLSAERLERERIERLLYQPEE
ncbi:MAG: hypothetical protein LBG08_06265, partial [Spirochaetaceae bacterium]|nr:hypothetical protein [Spirochaetaceae bacterium]